MKPTIHLMTTSFLENDGKLSPSDQIVWDSLCAHNIAGMCFSPLDAGVSFNADRCSMEIKGDVINPEGTLLMVRLTRGAPERSYEIARVFTHLGGMVSDPIESLVYSSGKLLPYLERQGNIGYVPSYFFDARTITLEHLLEKVQFPFILKPQDGFRGQGVSLINIASDFVTYLTETKTSSLIAQNYVDIVDESRVTVVGGKSISVLRKTQAASDHNVFGAEHSTNEPVTDQAVQEFAERAAQFGSADIYGTDVARARDGALYIIESNRSPGLVSVAKEVTEQVPKFFLERYFDKLNSKA